MADDNSDNRSNFWRLFNVVILGLSFMLLFTAFQTSSMVAVCIQIFQLQLESSIYAQTSLSLILVRVLAHSIHRCTWFSDFIGGVYQGFQKPY